jgi:TolA-binding protein
VLLAAAVSVLSPAGDAASALEDPEQIYSAAMTAFALGDYKTAASKLESVITQAGEGAQLESVYFTLGACFFNLASYQQAIDTLKKYLEKFPKGTRAPEARLFVAQAC